MDLCIPTPVPIKVSRFSGRPKEVFERGGGNKAAATGQMMDSKGNSTKYDRCNGGGTILS